MHTKRRRRLDAEYGEEWNPVSKGIRIGLVYPNTYFLGMSNLGFQAVYHILNQRNDVTCERIFLPDREDREKLGNNRALYVSLESGNPLASFDILAFSISFELDYLHLVEILRGGGVPPFRRDREYGRDPMVWIGGIAVTMNPEPLAYFSDLILIGEAEELLPEVLDRLTSVSVRDAADFEVFCRAARGVEGVYFPHAYTFRYDSRGRVKRVDVRKGYPSRVVRRWIRDVDRFPTVSRILTSETELNDMFLIEIDRGCGRHCRFCAAGYLYRPPRFRSREGVLKSAREGLLYSRRIGLVGTAVSDYPMISDLVSALRDLGAPISVSSLRVDSLRPELLNALTESGHKTLAFGIEGGSGKLRNILNKGISKEQILESARRVFSSKILNLKLYFMVGLPFEEDSDVTALVELVKAIRRIQLQEGKRTGRIGRIVVSLNIFVPKPNTPFQWVPMNKKDALSKKISYIKKNLQKEGNIRVIHELPKWSIIQGILSRGDRRIGSLLMSVSDRNGNWNQAMRETGGEFYDQPFRVREEEERFPWDLVDVGLAGSYLIQEYRKAATGRFTRPCPEEPGCRRCGVCADSG